MSRLAGDSGLSVSLLERGMAGRPYLKRALTVPEKAPGVQVSEERCIYPTAMNLKKALLKAETKTLDIPSVTAFYTHML